MSRIILAMFLCMILSSCATLEEIQQSESLNKVGSFQLDPVQPGNYWYDGKSYEYNSYEIRITSEPVRAKIEWGGKIIGTTPFTYRYTGVLDIDDRIIIRAIPMDKDLPAQEHVLRIRKELPGEIRFDFSKK